MAARRERRAFRTEAALELATLDVAMWGDDWTAVQVALGRQEAPLTVADVPTDLVQALSHITRACWHDKHDSAERGDDGGGIAVELLEAKRRLQRTVAAYLLRTEGRRGREDLRREALADTQASVADRPDPEW